MTHYFLDSSALVKRYVVEPGTAWVRALSAPDAGNTITISQITQVEVISGVMRRQREGRVDAPTARTIRLLLDRHASRQYIVIGLAAPVIQRAEDLIETHPLRAYDAVQLASALESNLRLVEAGLEPLIFVSADDRLLTTAAAVGLSAENPNAHV